MRQPLKEHKAYATTVRMCTACHKLIDICTMCQAVFLHHDRVVCNGTDHICYDCYTDMQEYDKTLDKQTSKKGDPK